MPEAVAFFQPRPARVDYAELSERSGDRVTQGELIEGCRRGDREAQHELYAHTSERIYRLLLTMTRDADAAFDLAQDTYVQAFTRIDQFDGRSTLATWVYRIAVNQALQFLRKGERAKRRMSKIDRPEAPADDSLSIQMDVSAALADLDPRDRTILILRYQDGLDYRAIADILECAPGTVASGLNRARQRLRDRLGGYAAREDSAAPEHPID